MVHKVGLLLLQVGGEAFLLGTLHRGLDGIALRGALSLFLLLDNLGETAVVALQRLAELGVGLALVIKVRGVGWNPDR